MATPVACKCKEDACSRGCLKSVIGLREYIPPPLWRRYVCGLGLPQVPRKERGGF